MPIQDNVVLVREGGEKHGEKIGAFFTSTSPRHPVAPHGLVFDIGEALEPPISLKIVTHVFEVRGLDIQNTLITDEHLDKELANMQELQTLELRILKCKEKNLPTKLDKTTKELPIRKE